MDREQAIKLARTVGVLTMGTSTERHLAAYILREADSKETVPEEEEDALSVRPAARVNLAAPASTPSVTVRAACDLSGPSGSPDVFPFPEETPTSQRPVYPQCSYCFDSGWCGSGRVDDPVSKCHRGCPPRIQAPSIFTEEPPTDVGTSGAENAATVPTIYPTQGMAWQDEQIAFWLESHAQGYEHAGQGEIAAVLRKKASGIRRREYTEVT